VALVVADRGEVCPGGQPGGGGHEDIPPVEGGADRPARARPREVGVGDGAGLGVGMRGQDRRAEAIVRPDEDAHTRHAERERPPRRADARIDDRDVDTPQRAVAIGGVEQKRPLADRLRTDLMGQVDDRRFGAIGEDDAVQCPDIDPRESEVGQQRDRRSLSHRSSCALAAVSALHFSYRSGALAQTRRRVAMPKGG